MAAMAACDGSAKASPSGRGSGTVTGSAPPTAAPLSEWQRLGATEVPPAALQRVSLGPIQVIDQAGGAVSDADARAWAAALLRTLGYIGWAVSQGQDGFLLHAGLSSVPTVLQPNLTDIAQARQAGARAEYERETIRRLLVRTVAQGLQGVFQSLQYAWTPYAIFLDALGPVGTTWVDAQGHRTLHSQPVSPNAAASELVGGEIRHDPLMGDVWVLASDWDCTSSSTRQALAPECNP
jgi:hypothetical protein